MQDKSAAEPAKSVIDRSSWMVDRQVDWYGRSAGRPSQAYAKVRRRLQTGRGWCIHSGEARGVSGSKIARCLHDAPDITLTFSTFRCSKSSSKISCKMCPRGRCVSKSRALITLTSSIGVCVCVHAFVCVCGTNAQKKKCMSLS